MLWDDNNGCVRNDSGDGGGEEPHFDAKLIGPHVLYCREIEKREKGLSLQGDDLQQSNNLQ